MTRWRKSRSRIKKRKLDRGRRGLMLEGLDTVDWAPLKCAHGPASDLPGLLRALASGDEGVRMEAVVELLDRVWHQGDVHPAAAAVVPFLYELLTHPDVPDRGAIVELLAAVADGTGGLRRVVRNDGEEMWRRILAGQGRSLEEELVAEDEAMRAIHDAVSAGLQHLLPYLSDVEHKWPVASALGNYPEHASWLVPAIDAALASETDEPVRRVLSEGKARLTSSGGTDAGTRSNTQV
jgi:hypothetical protein